MYRSHLAIWFLLLVLMKVTQGKLYEERLKSMRSNGDITSTSQISKVLRMFASAKIQSRKLWISYHSFSETDFWRVVPNHRKNVPMNDTIHSPRNCSVFHRILAAKNHSPPRFSSLNENPPSNYYKEKRPRLCREKCNFACAPYITHARARGARSAEGGKVERSRRRASYDIIARADLRGGRKKKASVRERSRSWSPGTRAACFSQPAARRDRAVVALSERRVWLCAGPVMLDKRVFWAWRRVCLQNFPENVMVRYARWFDNRALDVSGMRIKIKI